MDKTPAQPEAPPSKLLKTSTLLVFVLISGILSHAWMIGLEFQLDDWEQVQDASEAGGHAILLGQPATEIAANSGQQNFVTYFRPTLHYSLVLDYALYGANPAGFHLSSVIYFLITQLLLFLVLKQIVAALNPQAKRHKVALFAALTAMIFGFHPGNWGAVAWVAARGDVLTALFFLVALWALIHHRRRPRLWLFGCTIMATLFALGAKESGVVVPILVFLCDLLLMPKPASNKKPKWLKWEMLTILCLAPAFLIFRQVMFGEAALVYAGEARTTTWALVTRILETAPEICWRFIGGYFYFDSSASSWDRLLISAQMAFSCACGLLFATSIPFWGPKKWRILLALVLLITCGSAPALRFYEEANYLDVSRLFFLPQIFLALFLTLPFLLIGRRNKLINAGIALYLGLWTLVAGSSAIQFIDDQNTAAAMIKKTRDDILHIANNNNENGIAYIVTDLPGKRRHVPMYGVFIEQAFSMPFTNPELHVRSPWSNRLEMAMRQGEIFAAPVPVQFLRWQPDSNSADKGAIVPKSGVLLAPKGYQPVVEMAGASKQILETPIFPRDVEFLSLNFKDRPQNDLDLTLRLSSHEGHFDLPLKAKTEYWGNTETHLFALTQRPDWVLMSPILKFNVLSAGPNKTEIKSINFGAKMPIIEHSKANAETVSLSAPEPRIGFIQRPEFDWYRIRMFLDPGQRTLTLHRSKFTAEGPELFVTLSTSGVHSDESVFPWPILRQMLGAMLNTKGLGNFRIRYQVEALSGDISKSASPQALSSQKVMVIKR